MFFLLKMLGNLNEIEAQKKIRCRAPNKKKKKTKKYKEQKATKKVFTRTCAETESDPTEIVDLGRFSDFFLSNLDLSAGPHPPPDGPKISPFFFPLPLPFSHFFSLPLGVFSWNFGGV